MRLLGRYVFREILTSAVLGTLLATFVIFLNGSKELFGLLQEDDERRQKSPQQRAGQDLPKDVTAEQAEHEITLFHRERRRRDQRQLWLLVLERMQLQIVNQDRRRDHGSLG